MLQKVSDHIANYLARAAEAERRAGEASDEATCIDNEQMAKSWRHLASSYQFVESLDRFLLEVDRRNGGRPSENHDPAPIAPDAPAMRLRRVMKTIGPRSILRMLAAACDDESKEVGICEPALGLEWAMLARDRDAFARARSGHRLFR